MASNTAELLEQIERMSAKSRGYDACKNGARSMIRLAEVTGTSVPPRACGGRS